MQFTTLRSIFVLAFAAMLSACGVSQNIGDAKAEISTFHTDLDAGNLEGIWADAGEEIHKGSSKEDFLEFLGAVRSKLGKVQASEQVGWRTNATTGGTFVTINMTTTFENGTGQEQFIYRKDGEVLKLVGYHINSREMMLN